MKRIENSNSYTHYCCQEPCDFCKNKSFSDENPKPCNCSTKKIKELVEEATCITPEWCPFREDILAKLGPNWRSGYRGMLFALEDHVSIQRQDNELIISFYSEIMKEGYEEGDEPLFIFRNEITPFVDPQKTIKEACQKAKERSIKLIELSKMLTEQTLKEEKK